MTLTLLQELNEERIGTERPTRTLSRRALHMLYAPQAEWSVIAVEEGGFRELLPYTACVMLAPSLLGMLLPMTLFSALFFLMGSVGHDSVSMLMLHLLWSYVVHLLIVLIAAKALSTIVSSAHTGANWLLWCRVIVYGSTSYFLSAALAWIPFLGILFMFACAVRSAYVIRQGYIAILKVAR